MLTIALASALTLFSHASDTPEDAEEFLLADLGVRIDLPATWHMTRWSDWDFKAEHTASTGKLLLFAWATPGQIPLGEDGSGWSGVYTTKIEELQGAAPEVLSTERRAVAGRPMAFVDAAFTFGEGGPKGLMYGATVEIGGQNMHLAVVSSDRAQGALSAQRQAIVERLEVRSGPRRAVYGGEVEAAGVTTQLPKAWRAPFDDEVPLWVVPALKNLGLPDLEGCWSAVRPVAGQSVGGDADVPGGPRARSGRPAQLRRGREDGAADPVRAGGGSTRRPD